jgi:hypothetical protein
MRGGKGGLGLVGPGEGKRGRKGCRLGTLTRLHNMSWGKRRRKDDGKTLTDVKPSIRPIWIDKFRIYILPFSRFIVQQPAFFLPSGEVMHAL